MSVLWKPFTDTIRKLSLFISGASSSIHAATKEFSFPLERAEFRDFLSSLEKLQLVRRLLSCLFRKSPCHPPPVEFSGSRVSTSGNKETLGEKG